ncbi:MAG TPA: SLC13 family permease, partial [Longimicrobiales bacterium]|nr:SLC13 family permease [Longimicrobiales bacterium]
MNPAVASLLALIIAIVLSIVSRLNVGLIAVALAWLVGVYAAGLGADRVIRGFPAQLFLTLAGVTLLFAAAEANGTLERVAQRAFRLARGNARLLPPIFFLIAFAVSTVGPGAISSVALVAPLAMVVGARVGVPHFLSALMVANGANAGNLSPVSSVGVIANTKIVEAGLGAHPGKVWFANLLASALVALAAYLYFARQLPRASISVMEAPVPLTGKQRVTIAVVLAWIAGVLLLKLNLGLSAFAAVTLLIALGFTDQTAAIKRAPWGVILMVCGVTVLISLLEETGGLDLFTRILSRLAT